MSRLRHDRGRLRVSAHRVGDEAARSEWPEYDASASPIAQSVGRSVSSSQDSATGDRLVPSPSCRTGGRERLVMHRPDSRT